MAMFLTACDTGNNDAPVINANTLDSSSYRLADQNSNQVTDQDSSQDSNMVVVPTSEIQVVNQSAENTPSAKRDNDQSALHSKPTHHARIHHAHHVNLDTNANVDTPPQDLSNPIEHHEMHHVKIKHIENVQKANPDKTSVEKALWAWPAQGSLIKEFSDNHPGIEVQGTLGESVTAVAAGTVIYSQDNVNRYGNMIIIDHGNHLLTAYAYNATLLVSPGQQVVAGQKIATMGKDPENKSGLYFEVRRNGKPVNPLAYLSKVN